MDTDRAFHKAGPAIEKSPDPISSFIQGTTVVLYRGPGDRG